MKIAIIPARGGSKRIPRKNIKEFCGKPMIAWSIEAALRSGIFEHVIVSTDDREIAQIAKEHGAEVPFLRPPELANDFVGTVPVVKHALDWFVNNGMQPTFGCCIYATAPFVDKVDIQLGLERIQKTLSDYCFSVTKYPYPIQRSLKLDESCNVSMFSPEMFHVRSQDLEESWHDAGQFYWGTLDAWSTEKPIFNSKSCAVLLPRERVQDIDTPEDWTMAELLFKAWELRNERDISS